MSAALTSYRRHLVAKGNRAGSITTTMHRLGGFFPETALMQMTEAKARSYYDAYAETHAVDTSRNALREVKTFMRWAQRQGLIGKSPFEAVEGKGRRRRGKPQPRIDEARKLYATALARCPDDAGALAVVAIILLSLRASALVRLRVRDLDDDGHLVWIVDDKTEAGRRTLEVPDDLRPHLLELGRRSPNGWLFPASGKGHRSRHWVSDQAERLCKLAGIGRITAHGLRGLHASAAIEAGMTGHAVARTLGHASPQVTRDHYISEVSAARASAGRVERLMRVKESGEPFTHNVIPFPGTGKAQ